MSVNQDVIDSIVGKLKSSGKMSIAATHYGHFRVSVRHGPFGLLKSRYVLNPETLEALKQRVVRSGNRK